jgi:aminoglycoside phosphotransferase (APT) family kinase protein
MVGRPLTQLGLPVERQRPYLQQAGHYLRLIHAIELEGYGRLDEDLYLRSGQVRGEADTWRAAVLRGVDRGLDYLGRHHLLDADTIDTVPRLVRNHDTMLSAWTGSCLMHGDLGAVHIFVDVEREAVTGLIDFADRSAGDPLWDLTSYEWAGGDELLYLLEGYEPDVAMRDALDVKFLLYSVLQAVPWTQWCHERGYLQAIDVLAHVVRRARERLEVS